MSMTSGCHLDMREPLDTKVTQHKTSEGERLFESISIKQGESYLNIFCTTEQALEIGQQIAAQAGAILAAEKAGAEAK